MLKEEEILRGMLEGKRVRYLKGCPICGSSKTKKIKKRSIEYVKPRKWTDSGSHPWGHSVPNMTQTMYKIMYGCRQCGHIWIEFTKYRF